MNDVKISLLAVLSEDGFMAQYSGHAPSSWASKEEQDYFFGRMDGMDWSFMGRNTHEAAFREDRKRVVFSNQVPRYEWRSDCHLWVNPQAVSYTQILDIIQPTGECALLGGTRVHDWFLAAGQIDVIELSFEPISLGAGLPLFGDWASKGAMTPDQIRAELYQLGYQQQGDVRLLNKDGTIVLEFYPPSVKK